MTKKIWCFLGVHEYTVIAAFPYNDTSYGDSSPSTVYTLECQVCGGINEYCVYGGGRWQLKRDLKKLTTS